MEVMEEILEPLSGVLDLFMIMLEVVEEDMEETVEVLEVVVGVMVNPLREEMDIHLLVVVVEDIMDQEEQQEEVVPILILEAVVGVMEMVEII